MFIFVEIGKINKINNAANKATTPPSLFGIDRRIAYTHRKYHSGLIWIGVINGLANKKFSGSVRILGTNKIIIKNNIRAIKNPRASLVE